MRALRKSAGLAVSLALGGLSADTALDPAEIIRRSVAANQANWQAAPNYSFIERDEENKGGTRAIKTYQVTMIEGSPYNRLIAVNDHSLSSAQETQEKRKLRQEIAKRRRESPSARSRRMAKYQRERQQDHALMQEMGRAFAFRLIGGEQLNGRDVYVLEATPRPDYMPKSHQTRVLTGMKGKLWVDKKEYQWVKVEAEVMKPVSFGMFIAKVGPGTQFLLEQRPISGKLWLPSHFAIRVKASILGFKRQFSQDETYRDYKRNTG